jgi:predicted TIM-barrel fold metal-dependent hydrolase
VLVDRLLPLTATERPENAMPYAHRPDIFDADTHMMETPDWVARFADPEVRSRLAPFLDGQADGLKTVTDALDGFERRRTDAAVRAEAEAQFMSMRHKGWNGLGAFDAEERKRANDLMGFQGSLVFPTSAFNQVVAANEPEVLVGGARALNRGMSSFCAGDPRNIGTAYIPLGAGPDAALQLIKEAIGSGLRVMLIDTIAPEGARSFTHPDYDRVWAMIESEGLGVALHVGANGGSYNPVPASFYSNGKALPSHADGDAPRDALSYMSIQYNAELFLAAMIFDGVFERFPGLRIAVVELGASWIISWMKQLDQAFRSFRRLQDLSQVRLQPSDYVRRQIKVTPFAGEDIGWLISAGAEDLLMFASDYPHHEGTDDPIGRFERTMEGVSEVARAKFYNGNFRMFMGRHLVHGS